MKKINNFYFFIYFNKHKFTNKFSLKNYFSNPLDIELILNGNFGESRPSHFHSGIDFKTQFKEGLNVFSSAKGYVSRISIKTWWIWKKHYTLITQTDTLQFYAHLKKFYNKKN